MNMNACKSEGKSESSCNKCLSWSGIFAGMMVAIGLTILFDLLTQGMGISLFGKDEHGMQTLVFGGFAWALIGVYVVLFLAGAVSGHLAGCGCHTSCCKSMLYGMLTWCSYTVASIIILALLAVTPASSFFKSAFVHQSDAAVATVHPAKEVAVPAKSSAKKAPAAAVETEVKVDDAHKVGFATLAGFLIALSGIIGSCIGAYYGMRKCCKKACDSKSV